MNVFEIRKNKELFYIFDEKKESNFIHPLQKFSVVIMYLYYEDTIENYYKYIEAVSKSIDLVLITSVKLVADKLIDRFKTSMNIKVVLKDNRGHDISALLIECREIIKQYKYVCFVHDKKEHRPQEKKDVQLWIENLWGNLVAGESYINQVLQTFEENLFLGVLAPPDPVGDHFCSWYGYGWHGSFEVTKRLASMLDLKCEISEDIPPLGLGTALWFRSKALWKLFDYGWKYDDFDDNKLRDSSYISYGIERIFPYVAQDAGYDTGEIMTLSYARKQNMVLKDSINRIFNQMYHFYPFPTANNANNIQKSLDNLLLFCNNKQRIALYGTGYVGKFCLSYLRKNGIEPECFLVTRKEQMDSVDFLEVRSITDCFNIDIMDIVITPVNQNAQRQIVETLTEININDYYIFWKYDN
ncbi:rhamnan synthesis F family protein [Lachnoclostridium sp.]|uniref:rhamnan synthesis F family protein n=1 Tax=Lachnoclostridium sp. TaxID=2028282 RepID=UPI00289C774D|nr:rhamnan synthesis F family protein [Lachnoclostridium sp.]